MLKINFQKKKYKKINQYRFNISHILMKNNLRYTNNEKDFNVFLLNDEFNQFNTWFEVCSAESESDFEINYKKLQKIIDIFNKSKDMISFKKLFKIDKIWYEYFNTSADINGNIIQEDGRYGVNKNYVLDIIKIQKLVLDKTMNLDNIIEFYLKLKYIYYRCLNI